MDIRTCVPVEKLPPTPAVGFDRIGAPSRVRLPDTSAGLSVLRPLLRLMKVGPVRREWMLVENDWPWTAANRNADAASVRSTVPTTLKSDDADTEAGAEADTADTFAEPVGAPLPF